MKKINSYKEFLDELDERTKEVEVDKELFDWLKHNIGFSCTRDTDTEYIGRCHGIDVHRKKKGRKKNV